MSSADLTAELPSGAVRFTDRSDGNMSSVGGVGCEHGAANRARLRDALGLRRLTRSYQVHGAAVRIVLEMPAGEAEPAQLEQADGQATSLAGLGSMVLAADCVPVAIGAAGAVAMVHAGWRGLSSGVLESGARAVRELAGGGSPLHAVIGPCAGPCCYEVGPEVHEQLGTGVRRRANADLCAIAAGRLRDAGVASVQALGGCTICEQRFFSHRREGARAGRQAGVAWLS